MWEKSLRKALVLAVGAALGSPGAGLANPGAEYDEATHLTAHPENGRKVYEICAVCHSPKAWGMDNGRYPQLAGQHPNVIIKQLADIRAGNRDNPTMYPFTLPKALGGAQEIADVAAYISKLPMSPHNGVGPGMDLAHGEMLYKTNCATCHGKNGEGDNEKAYPRIQGQHYNYLLRQMIWIQSGKRRNADPTMVKQVHNFTSRDITAVIDYASRLRPAAELVAEPSWQNPDFPSDFRSAPPPPMPPFEMPPFPEFRHFPQPPEPPPMPEFQPPRFSAPGPQPPEPPPMPEFQPPRFSAPGMPPGYAPPQPVSVPPATPPAPAVQDEGAPAQP